MYLYFSNTLWNMNLVTNQKEVWTCNVCDICLFLKSFFSTFPFAMGKMSILFFWMQSVGCTPIVQIKVRFCHKKKPFFVGKFTNVPYIVIRNIALIQNIVPTFFTMLDLCSWTFTFFFKSNSNNRICLRFNQTIVKGSHDANGGNWSQFREL